MGATSFDQPGQPFTGENQADLNIGPNPVEIGAAAADRLQALLERSQSWPIWAADPVGGIDTNTFPQVGSYAESMRDTLALWVAMRESDRRRLINLTGWEKDRILHVDPLPERISAAFADLLYGEEPKFFAANKRDQDTIEEMVDETGLAIDLWRWVDMQVSEGEVWWRAWTDRDVSDWPLIDISSRLNVIPLFAGHKILAAAFVDTVYTNEIKVENTITIQHYRHIEIQAMGYVRNLLYKGTINGLGNRMPLNTLVETENLPDQWPHNLPVILAGRVPNKLGRDFRLGISEYKKVRDLLMDLNEARTIMAENARLVLKARMVVPANAVGPDGQFDATQDIIVQESLDEEMAGKNSNSYAVLEYNFRARELIEHKQELTLDILARCGLAEQFVQESRGGAGEAFTGTALRTRLIPTLQSAKGKAKNMDREIPKVLRALALLSALEPENGGCGQQWAQADGKHIQQRSSIIPDDINERTQRHVMAVQGEIMSIETAVREEHEDWDDEQVEEEVERIRNDRAVGPSWIPDDPNAINPDDPDIPNVPPGGPGSAVPTPADLVGSRQPGAGRPVDGQSPGNQPPQVRAGGRVGS